MDSSRQFANLIHVIQGYTSHKVGTHPPANHTAVPLKSMPSLAAAATKPANVTVAVVATKAETGGAEAIRVASIGAAVIKTAQRSRPGRTLQQFTAAATATISARFSASTAFALTFTCLTLFFAFFATVSTSAITTLCWLVDR
jgi:hypothetical protein